MSITLTPLCGARSPPGTPQSYLLCIQDARILLDCGTRDRCEEDEDDPHGALARRARAAYLAQLKEIAPSLTLVLLSSPALSSIGLLPYLVHKLRLSCPIYATLPCRTLGQIAVKEWSKSRLDEDGPVASTSNAEAAPEDQCYNFTEEEINSAFDRITAVVFSQVVRLGGRQAALSILAHPSGTTLGGTLWSLRSATTDSFLYAPTFNHIKERSLDSAAFLVRDSEGKMVVNEAMRRTGTLIVGSERSLIKATKAKERDAKMLEMINRTLRSSGTVLMPVDSSARLIELLVLLEQHWSFSNLSAQFPLCFVTKTGEDVINIVRQMTDLLGGQLALDFDEKERVLRFRNIQIFPSAYALLQQYRPEQPKLILAAPATLAGGHSRELFTIFADSSLNLVLLTSRGEEGSLARHLADLWEEEQVDENAKWGRGGVGEPARVRDDEGRHMLQLMLKQKIYLEGQELQDFLDEKEAQEERDRNAARLEARKRQMMEVDDDDSSDSSDDDEAIQAEQARDGEGVGRRAAPLLSSKAAFKNAEPEDAPTTFDIYVKPQDILKSYSTGERFRMFPYAERRRKVDSYGEAIDHEKWSRKPVAETNSIEAAVTAKIDAFQRKIMEIEAKTDPPHKFITKPMNVQILSQLLLVDMEGKADGRALRTILPLLAAKKIVLINGPEDATEDLANALITPTMPRSDILCPSQGEEVYIGEVTKSYSIRLDERLMDSLSMRRVENYEIARVQGTMQASDESTIPTLGLGTASGSTEIADIEEEEGEAAKTPTSQPEATEEQQITPKIEEMPMEVDSEDPQKTLPPLPQTHFIGDVKLASLKNILSAKRIPVVFVQGVLICGPVLPQATEKKLDARLARLAKIRGQQQEEEVTLDTSGGRVAVRKQEDGGLIIDGQPGDTFYAVKAAVYELHAAA